jgi:hypothetical protein
MGFSGAVPACAASFYQKKIIYFLGDTAFGGLEGGPFLDIIYIS